jgi:aspartyl-tRNA(Asn)/glutamyl-tRNA(Gln) amidotransferase subunit C
VITPQQVREVLALARLRAAEQDIPAYAEELGRILEHVARLQALDTQGVPPTPSALVQPGVVRPDQARPPLAPEAAVANAPEERGGMFAVPRVVEEGVG